jgi:putative transcriptional regulator
MAEQSQTPSSLKGHFLLDSGQLTGSFFHRTVVLICQHDAEGAFGLVLNRLSGTQVEDALLSDLPDKIKEQPVYAGGPVQPTALSFLHADQFLLDGNVLPNLSLDHSLDTLVEIAGLFSSTQQIRIFAGYAGWGAGQLDDEIKRKAWVIHPASLELVFYGTPEEHWREILRRKGGKFRLLSMMPDDLTWN